MYYVQSRTPKILDECSGCTGVLLSLNMERQTEEPQSLLLASSFTDLPIRTKYIL